MDMAATRELYPGGWPPECGEVMLRMFSNTCFGLALGTTFLIRLFNVSEDWIRFAVFCVCMTMFLTNFMPVRFMGLGGVAGLSIVFYNLAGISLPAILLTIFTAGLLTSGVFLAFCADLPHSAKEETKEKHNL
jgi:hypothetical protein